jgi:hypothetical protein
MEQSRGPSRRRWLFFLVVASGIIGGCAGLYDYLSIPYSGVDFEKLEGDIRRELPPGTTRQVVLRWLKGRADDYYWSVSELSGTKDPIIMVGIDHESFLEDAGIYIYFYFDANGRLERFTIDREVIML